MAKRYETSRVGNGQVKVSTYEREEQRRIERTIELFCAKGRGAANDGCVMWNYTSTHLAVLKLGGVGRRRALLDVSRFLHFAVKKCGAESAYLPFEAKTLKS